MKVCGEERINAYVAGNQSAPAVTRLADGGYVVAWVSDGQDGSSGGIYKQRFDANGIAVGREFHVSRTTANDQTLPTISGLSDGSFVVIWEDRDGDGSCYGVYTKRYDNAGNLVAAKTRANTYVSGHRYEPVVATYANGRYVVVWRSDNQDGSGAGVDAQRCDAAGAPAGQFLVNQATVTDSTGCRADCASRWTASQPPDGPRFALPPGNRLTGRARSGYPFESPRTHAHAPRPPFTVPLPRTQIPGAALPCLSHRSEPS